MKGGTQMKISNLLGSKTYRDSCTTDKTTGEVVCSRKTVHKDGTTTEIAGFRMSVTADCNPVMTVAYENEEGHLQQLEKKFAQKIIAKCSKNGRNVPAEF